MLTISKLLSIATKAKQFRGKLYQFRVIWNGYEQENPFSGFWEMLKQSFYNLAFSV